MAWRDRIERLFRPTPEVTDYLKWNAVVRQASELLCAKDLQGVADLVKQHRKSDVTVLGIGGSIKTWMHNVMATPEDAARRDVRKLMERLRKTSVVKQGGKGLANVPIYTNNPVFSTLAMHTLLLNDYLNQHPESKLPRPNPSEVGAAVRIVENNFLYETMQELGHVAESDGRYLPPYYITSLFGWNNDGLESLQERYERQDNQGEPEEQHPFRELEDRIWQIENHRGREAETILETNRIYPLPEYYTQKLELELQGLGNLASFNEKIDGRYFNRKFLDKYGIKSDMTHGQQHLRVEAAFRDLDARIVRLTGRQPLADELFESLKQERMKAIKVYPNLCQPDAPCRKKRQQDIPHPEQPSACRKIRR